MKSFKQAFLVEHLAVFPEGLPENPEDMLRAVEDDGIVYLMEERLRQLVGLGGEIITGPRQVFCNAVQTDYLVMLQRDARLSLLSSEWVAIITPEGHIFFSGDRLMYVTHDKVEVLSGEVMLDVFAQMHGDSVADIEAELHCRLLQWVSNRYMKEDAITDEQFCRQFIAALQERPLASLTWAHVEAIAENCLTTYYCLPSGETEP